jgi:hypothetical protein
MQYFIRLVFLKRVDSRINTNGKLWKVLILVYDIVCTFCLLLIDDDDNDPYRVETSSVVIWNKIIVLFRLDMFSYWVILNGTRGWHSSEMTFEIRVKCEGNVLSWSMASLVWLPHLRLYMTRLIMWFRKTLQNFRCD